MNNPKVILKIILNYLILFFAVIVLFVIQTSVFPLIPYFKASANLLLLITFLTGFVFGENKGLYVGILCGILSDIFYTGNFGYFSLIYVCIGYFNGMVYHYIYEDNIIFPSMLCIVNTLIFNLYIYFTSFFIHGKSNIISYFGNIIIPSIILTLVFTLLSYKIALFLKNKFSSYKI